MPGPGRAAFLLAARPGPGPGRPPGRCTVVNTVVYQFKYTSANLNIPILVSPSQFPLEVPGDQEDLEKIHWTGHLNFIPQAFRRSQGSPQRSKSWLGFLKNLIF